MSMSVFGAVAGQRLASTSMDADRSRVNLVVIPTVVSQFRPNTRLYRLVK
jgi:hypothetical protein